MDRHTHTHLIDYAMRAGADETECFAIYSGILDWLHECETNAAYADRHGWRHVRWGVARSHIDRALASIDHGV